MTQFYAVHGGRLPGEVSEPIVQILRDLLEQAERGEVRAIAVAAAREDDIYTDWVWSAGSRNDLSTGINLLALRHTQAILNEE